MKFSSYWHVTVVYSGRKVYAHKGKKIERVLFYERTGGFGKMYQGIMLL